MADAYSFYIRPLALDDVPEYIAHHKRCHSTSQLYLTEASSLPTNDEVASSVSDPYPESLLLIAVPSTDAVARSAEGKDASLHYVEHSMDQQDASAGAPSKHPTILGHAVVLPYDGNMLRASMAHAAKVTVVLPGFDVLDEKLYDAVEQALFKELLKRSKATNWPYKTFITKMPFIEGQTELVRAFDNCCDSGFKLVGREKGIVVKNNVWMDMVTFQA